VKNYYVYLTADRHRGAIYTGFTNNLERRTAQHKEGSTPGFTAEYHANLQVYYEETNDVLAAIAREKQIKGWTRARKIALIESVNPRWEDLSQSWDAPTPPPDSFAKMPPAGNDRGRRSE